MSNLSIVFYGCLFYICIIGFLWNFNSFTFPEKVIMFTLISGIQCIVGLQREDSEV